MNKKFGIQSQDNSLKIIDWIIFIILATFCFFTMQQGDILHTAGSSFSLLNGHFFDFYEYTAQYMGVNNYMITTYILFAIWNIPIRLLGIVNIPTQNVPYGVVMWYKALPALVYILCAYLICAICKELDFDANKSKIAAYAFMTMPIAFFSQFIFGQYDIFTVFFMLLGVFFYFKPGRNSLYYSSLLFGVGCTFKYFALLIYLPLILLREKRINKLLQHGALGIFPVLLAICPFLPSEKFQSGVLGFGASSYIFATGIDNGFARMSVIPVIWTIICMYAFLKEDLSCLKDIFAWSTFICTSVLFLCFGLSKWHPQWLLLGAPFWTLNLLTRKRVDVSCLLDIAMMLFFSIFVVNGWPNHVDQQLFALGAFGDQIVGRTEFAHTMRELYQISDWNLIWTCFVGILAANTFMSHPKHCSEDLNNNKKEPFGWLRARFLVGVSIFFIPMLICLMSMLSSPKLSYAPAGEVVGIIPPTSDTQKIEQVFTPSTSTISHVCIQIGTYMRTNYLTLKMNLVDDVTGSVLVSEDIDASNLIDNAYETVHFDPIQVEVGKHYKIKISSVGADDQNTFSIYRTADNTATDCCYAQLDGIIQTFNLAIKVYGD